MQSQPPGDTSALARTVKEQTHKLQALETFLKTEIADIKRLLADADRRISSLTDISTRLYSDGYSGGEILPSQEQDGDQMQTAEATEHYNRTDKDNPPLISEETQLTCVRCGYKWTPRTKRPKKCPECEAPWWFPPKWRWRQSQTQSQEQTEQFSSLTDLSCMRYNQNTPSQSQEESRDQMQSTEEAQRYAGRDKDNPPLIPEGTQLTCVRCNYQWTPHSRHPQKCPKCRAPWWFPPKWRWHQSQTQSQ